MAAVMLFLQQTTGKTERHTHFCMPLEPVFTRDCGGRVHFTDEPTGALDSRSSAQVMKMFTDIHKTGQTILVVTHSVKTACHAGRVLFIRDGQLFNQLYCGNMDNEAFGEKISDNLKILLQKEELYA